MRGEHQFDGQPVERTLHHLGRVVFLFELRDRGPKGFGKRRRIALFLARSEHAHSLAIFGDVRQIKKNAERPGDDAGRRVVDGRNLRGQLFFGLRRTTAALQREPANLFDKFESGSARQIVNHPTKHVAQQPHVAMKKIAHDSNSLGPLRFQHQNPVLIAVSIGVVAGSAEFAHAAVGQGGSRSGAE